MRCPPIPINPHSGTQREKHAEAPEGQATEQTMKHLLRRALAVIALAGYGGIGTLAPSALAANDNELLENLSGAVLDWCDAQGGQFMLPHISAPSCKLNQVVYLGTLKGVFGAAGAPDSAWWWELRSDIPADLEIGVLWYTGPNNPMELCAASNGVLCQCDTAREALDNPARVPVVLVGPGTAVCEASL